MPLQLNCRILTPSRSGPVAMLASGAVSPLFSGFGVAVEEAECDDSFAEYQLPEPEEDIVRDLRVPPRSEDSGSLLLLAGETGVEQAGQLHGASLR